MGNAIDYRFKLRRALAATWAGQNPTNLDGEMAWERDTGKLKVSNGITPWNTTKYIDSSIELSKLKDVDITGRTDAMVVTWDQTSAKHVYKTISAGGIGGNFNADTHPAIPTAWDDEFEFGSALDTTGARFSGANAWSTITAGGSTFTNSVAQGALKLTNSLPSGSSTHVCAAVQAVPSGSWTIGCKLSSVAQIRTNSAAGMYIGLGGTNKLIMFGLQVGSTSAVSIFVQRDNSPTSPSANQLVTGVANRSFGAVGSAYGQTIDGVYLRVSWDGTNIIFYMSWDGINWNQVYTETGAAFLGGAPTNIGIFSDAETAGATVVASFDWFRRTA